jgi:hypothetical protein
MKKTNIAQVLTIAVIATGCGGGSNNISFCGYDAFGNPIYCQLPNVPNNTQPTPVASSSTFQLQPALNSLATQSLSFNINATDNAGNNYSYTYTVSPQSGQTVFNGQNVISSTVTTTLTENGSAIALYGNLYTNTVTHFYNPTTYQLVGTSGNYPGSFALYTSQNSVPSTANENYSVLYLNGNLYHDTQMQINDGSVTKTLQLNANTAQTALMCFSNNTTLTQQGVNDGLYNGTLEVCFIINTSGVITGMQATLPINNSILTFY